MDATKNKSIVIIAKLFDNILIINSSDMEFIGTERSIEIKCVQVDLQKLSIDDPFSYESHMKFNPWEDVNKEEEKIIIQILNTKFSDDDIYQKITLPLCENALKK